MFSKVHSGGILGVEGYLIEVEADVSDGLPGFYMVGYLSSEVREAQDRVRTALKNSGFQLQAKKITVNLSPADIRKEGTAFDLPVAVAILAAYDKIPSTYINGSLFVGELGLSGEIKPIPGILSLVYAAKAAGLTRCILPLSNINEGGVIQGIDVIGVQHIREVIDLLMDPLKLEEKRWKGVSLSDGYETQYAVDYSEVNGQLLMKRATEVAVAGMHNILYIGSAGTGKSMVAQRIPTIMPDIDKEEAIEISKIYSICGLLPANAPILMKRPFRSPHHTISPQALAGGGRFPKPGEISLASGGVLFLDEIPEFQKQALEVLRQPLEERKITISRLHTTCEFPANFMLAAAMNPCPCSYFPDRNRCSCSEGQIKKYLSRISKPLLDRIDICVEAVPVSYEDLKQKGGNESSQEIKYRVEQARKIQAKRFAYTGIYFNSEMNSGLVKQYCSLGVREEKLMKQIYENMGLSTRAYLKILRVARTIADLDQMSEISYKHLCEAIGYRTQEEKYWGGLKSEKKI